MEKIANLTVTEAKALRLLERKHGADLPVLCSRLSLEERQARSLIDRLRRKGVRVERTGKAKFHADDHHKLSAWNGMERRHAILVGE